MFFAHHFWPLLGSESIWISTPNWCTGHFDSRGALAGKSLYNWRFEEENYLYLIGECHVWLLECIVTAVWDCLLKIGLFSMKATATVTATLALRWYWYRFCEVATWFKVYQATSVYSCSRFTSQIFIRTCQWSMFFCFHPSVADGHHWLFHSQWFWWWRLWTSAWRTAWTAILRHLVGNGRYEIAIKHGESMGY